jgi:hypothetical protein
MVEQSLVPEVSEYYVYEYYIVETEAIFYVGMGKGRRAVSDYRNNECERIKSENDWTYRIVQESLSKEEAGALEEELIIKYREKGEPITNIQPGGAGEKVDSNSIAIAKYLLFLGKHNVVKMTHGDIYNESGAYSSLVSYLYNDENMYADIPAIVPENVEEIIKKYARDTYSEKEKEVGYIRYLLDLIEKGALKMHQAQLAEEFQKNATNISDIKKKRTYMSVPAIVPPNIGYYLRKYDINTVTEEERKVGNVKFVLRLREEGIINIQNNQIAEVLGVSTYYVYDIKRPPDEKKNRYPYPEVRPEPDIMVKLTPFFALK